MSGFQLAQAPPKAAEKRWHRLQGGGKTAALRRPYTCPNLRMSTFAISPMAMRNIIVDDPP
jgi:hypothetical protein